MIPLAALLCLAASAQQPPFRTQSRLVLVPVTVTDHKGKSIDGLKLEDFRVLDNGKPRAIETVDDFGTGVAPLSLVVAVQSSGISAPAMAKIRKTASIVQPLITGERGAAALLAFDDNLHWLSDFTSFPDKVGKAFDSLEPGTERGARLFDAVMEAARKLERRENQRRVLLLISESRDRGSETKLAQVVQAVQRADVQVYALTYSVYATTFTAKPSDVQRSSGGLDIIGGIGELARIGKTNSAQALAGATGGRVYGFLRQRALERTLQSFGEELHSQYLLSFIPGEAAPGYHALSVHVKRKGDLRVRARPGYWE